MVALYEIDGDAEPSILHGWTRHTHLKFGKAVHDPSRVRLHVTPEQAAPERITGHDLLEIVMPLKPYNANYLDFYLANPHLIPKEWRSKYVFFWGTIYVSATGTLCVRYLKFDEQGVPKPGLHFLQFQWGEMFPAAVYA